MIEGFEYRQQIIVEQSNCLTLIAAALSLRDYCVMVKLVGLKLSVNGILSVMIQSNISSIKRLGRSNCSTL